MCNIATNHFKIYHSCILLFVQVDSFVKIFPNVSHGWTIRYDTKDPKAVKASEKARRILLDWFDKHLK